MEDQSEDLIAALNRHSNLLEQRIRQYSDWRIALRNGILAGLGSILGATLVLSLIMWVLKPFSSFAPLKPTLDRLTEALERDSRGAR